MSALKYHSTNFLIPNELRYKNFVIKIHLMLIRVCLHVFIFTFKSFTSTLFNFLNNEFLMHGKLKLKLNYKHFLWSAPYLPTSSNQFLLLKILYILRFMPILCFVLCSARSPALAFYLAFYLAFTRWHYSLLNWIDFINAIHQNAHILIQQWR